jgi:hypothetical protein
MRCTLGVLQVNGRGVFQTIEKPWIPTIDGPWGTPMKSSIGVGSYRMEPRYTEARGNHWQLVNPQLGVYRLPSNVPIGSQGQPLGRSLVLIHAANYAHELLGCIAPGKSRDRQDGEWAVRNSRAAMNEIKLLLGGSFDLQLVIT